MLPVKRSVKINLLNKSQAEREIRVVFVQARVGMKKIFDHVRLFQRFFKL